MSNQPQWGKKKKPSSPEELIAALLQKIKDSFEGGDSGKGGNEPPKESGGASGPGLPGAGKILTVVAVLVALNFLSSCFYTIEPGERGVVLRLGKYLKTTSPGLNFKLPLLDSLTKVDYIEVLTDRRQVAERVMALSRQAREEILMLFKRPLVASIEENLAEAHAVADRIVRRGVFEESAADDPEFFDLIRQFHALGEEIRFVPELPIKVNLYDERVAVILLQNPVSGQSSLTCLVIEHISMAKALKVAFESLWAQGVDFETFCAQRGLDVY